MEDPLSDVFASLNVRTGSLSGLAASGSWRFGFPVHEHIKIAAVLTGRCWLAADGGDPVELRAGDCYLLAARDTFELASDLAAPLTDGVSVYRAAPARVVRVGAADELLLLGSSVDLLDSTVALLLAGLPPVSVIRAGTPQALAIAPLLRLLLDEVDDTRLGTSAMSERLTGILFIQAMRALVEEPVRLRGWLGALGDRHVGRALLALHQRPGEPWTVAKLGAEVGMSRAGFAARFKDLVGLPPLDYLQRWRIHAAGRVLRTSDRTVASVAAEFGYASESSFATAFKRVTGVPPARYRDDRLATFEGPVVWPDEQFRVGTTAQVP